MVQVQGSAIARRFCAVMEMVCWGVFVAAVVFVLFQARNLWGALHGLKSGVSVGVSVGVQGPHATAPSSTTRMIGGSVVTTIGLISSVFAAAAVWQARAFFGSLARGDMFAPRTLSALRGFAVATLFMQLLPTLSSVAGVVLLGGLKLDFTTTLWMVFANLLNPGAAPNIVLLALLVAMVGVLGRAGEVAEDHAAIV